MEIEVETAIIIITAITLLLSIFTLAMPTAPAEVFVHTKQQIKELQKHFNLTEEEAKEIYCRDGIYKKFLTQMIDDLIEEKLKKEIK